MALRTADPDQDEKSQADRDYDSRFQGVLDNYHNETEHPLGEEEARKNPIGKKPKINKLDQDDLQTNEENTSEVSDDLEERTALNERVTEASPQTSNDYFVGAKNAPSKSKSSMRTRTSIFGLIGGGGIIMSLVVGMFMFFTIYRSEHLRNLLWDYRFARFHGQIAKRVNANLKAQEAGRFTSSENKGLKISEKLSSTNPEITAKIKLILKNGGHTNFFRPDTRAPFRDRVKVSFGDRFKPFQEKLRAKLGNETRAPTEEEKRLSLKETDIERARGGSTSRPGGTLGDGFDDAQSDILSDSPEPRAPDLVEKPILAEGVPESKTVKRYSTGTAKTFGKISAGAALVTYGCIINDLSSTLDEVIRTRIEAPQRLAAGLFGTAEQTKSGSNIEPDVLAIQDNQLTRAEESAGLQLASDASRSPNDTTLGTRLDNADLPFTFFGIPISTIASVNRGFQSGLDTVASLTTYGLVNLVPGGARALRNEVCSVILNPVSQLVLVVVDFAALALSFGSVTTVSQVVLRSLETGIRIGASVGLNKIVFEYLIPKVLFNLAGSSGVLSRADPQAGNKLDIGAAMLASQYGKFAGGSEISIVQASRDQQEALVNENKIRPKNEGVFAYINPKSPYSILGKLSLKLPGDAKKVPVAMVKMSFANTFALFGKNSPLLGKAQAAEPYSLYTYNVPQYGVPDSTIDLDPIDNAKVVEGAGLNAMIQKYGSCFTNTLAQDALDEKDEKNSGVDCNEEMAQRVGLYIIDSCTSTFLSDNEGENCNPLPGAGDVTSAPTSTSSAIPGVLGDATKDQPCAPGSNDLGLKDGYSGGIKSSIRICDLPTLKSTGSRDNGTAKVNAAISANVIKMVADAKAQAVSLVAGSSFREMAHQEQLCQDDTGCRSGSSYANVAKPGTSNHQLGVALDFDGVSKCPQKEAAGRCVDPANKSWVWLRDNAEKYGFKQYIKEAWHWSPTGN